MAAVLGVALDSLPAYAWHIVGAYATHALFVVGALGLLRLARVAQSKDARP